LYILLLLKDIVTGTLARARVSHER